MLKVGLTGNIASGKSSVVKFLKEKGYQVADADKISHKLLLNDIVKNEIIKTFETENILENGEISRPKLGKIVFTDDEKRKKLEAIMHPRIKEEIRQFFNAIEEEKVVFVEVPLLFEAKFDDLFDKIILVFADDEIRLKRLMQRNTLTQESALHRIAIQMNQHKKKPLSAHVILNNGTLEDLEIQINEVLRNLL